MPRKKKERPETLSTLWRIPDDLWQRIAPILAELDPPAKTGRPRIDPRAALDAIIYRGRAGLQWNQLPKAYADGTPCPDDASVHRTMQRWVEKGAFSRIWAVLIEACDDLGGVSFEWQAADGCLGKPGSVGTRSAPTPPIGASRA